MKTEYYCSCCLQEKKVRYFSLWLADKTKSRRCDSCQDSDRVKRVMKEEKEIDTSRFTPVLAKLAGEELSKKKVQVRRDIENYAEQKLLDSEFEL